MLTFEQDGHLPWNFTKLITQQSPLPIGEGGWGLGPHSPSCNPTNHNSDILIPLAERLSSAHFVGWGLGDSFSINVTPATKNAPLRISYVTSLR